MNIWLLIINGVYSILATIIGLLPNIDTATNTAIANSLTDFKTYIAPINYIFPVGTFFTVLGIIVTVEGIIFTYKLILWISTNVTAGFLKN